MELNAQELVDSAVVLANRATRPGKDDRIQDQMLEAQMATYYATLAVYALLADVREGFARLGMIPAQEPLVRRLT